MDQDPSSLDPDIIEVLKGLESQKAEYPPDLLAARRASFLQEVARRAQVENEERVTSDEKRVLTLLGSLKNEAPEYPAELLSARRSLFRRQVVQVTRASVWDAWIGSLRNLVSRRVASIPSPQNTLRASLRIAALTLTAMAGLALYANQSLSAGMPESRMTSVGHTFLTPTPRAPVVCRDGYEPPLCLMRRANKSRDLTLPGNGTARPAVAKDTMSGQGQIHRAANVNDGLYGPGASWVSNSPNSWINIDLGKITPMNTIAFGRDRLGNYNDGDPGRFVIALATSEDVYANGDSSNDEQEYVEVYDSDDEGFDGEISGAETVTAQFQLREARYIKITFANARTAVDEVEVFVARPPTLANDPTREPKQERPSKTPVPALATATVRTVDTAVPSPTHTPFPTVTSTLAPTDTAVPPTNTPVPPTETDVPPPTNTPIPTTTDTAVPAPTNTDVPALPSTPMPASTQNLRPTETSLPAAEGPSALPQE